jgi:hypothetical protein
MKKRARINIPGAYKLAAEQKSALIVFFSLTTQSQAFAVVRESFRHPT